MSKSPFKSSTGRNWTATLSTIIGIALVLFMLGILSLILINANKLSTYFRENVTVQVYLKDDVKEVEILQLKKFLEAEEYTRAATHITQEEAAREMEEELGKEFVDFLGFNPIPASIDLKLNSSYAQPDSLQWIEQDIIHQAQVKEVVYQKVLFENIDQNIKKFSLILGIISIVLLLVAVALINNTIRLAIFSKRFLIKSMQLVGATRGFIVRPFIWQGIWHGLIAGIIALALIVALIYFSRSFFPDFFKFQDIETFGQLFGVIFLLAILISWISTSMAVGKYIRLRQDQLY